MPKNKWEAISELLSTIREKPRSVREIVELRDVANDSGQPSRSKKKFPYPRSTIYNWLHQPLEILGLIYYNSEDRRWYPSESKRQEFKNKMQREQALRHSKRIVFGDPESGDYNPGRLIPAEIPELATFRADCQLMSHLKTGYFREVWLPLEEYRKLSNLPKMTGEELSTLVNETCGWKEAEDKEQVLNLPHVIEYRPEEPEEKDKEKIEKLKKDITQELLLIIERIRAGWPMKGYCKVCKEYVSASQ